MSSEGSAGTVDSVEFIKFVRTKLTDVLGNYSKGEENSIVVLDNASIHNDPEIRRLIYGKGAIMVLSAPYSPDLNPIEKFFSVYKSNLRREYLSGKHWFQVHEEGMSAVTPKSAYNLFAHCGVPMCDSVPPGGSGGKSFLAAILAYVIDDNN